MTPEQERQIIDALIGVEETETLESLRAEGALIIQRLGFSSAAAMIVLGVFEGRRLIVPEITPGRQVDGSEPMPIGRWRWSTQR